MHMVMDDGTGVLWHWSQIFYCTVFVFSL